MSTENRPFGQASDMLTPVTSDVMAMAAMIEAMRAQTKAVERNNDKLDDMSSAVAKVREDIAVMKVHNEQVGALTDICASLNARLDKLEIRNAEQDGAFKFGEFLKEWLPWLFAGVAVFWGLVRKG